MLPSLFFPILDHHGVFSPSYPALRGTLAVIGISRSLKPLIHLEKNFKMTCKLHKIYKYNQTSIHKRAHTFIFTNSEKPFIKSVTKTFIPRIWSRKKVPIKWLTKELSISHQRDECFITLYMCLFLRSNNLSETLYCWKKFQPYYRRSKLT